MRNVRIVLCLTMLAVVLTWGIGQTAAQSADQKKQEEVSTASKAAGGGGDQATAQSANQKRRREAVMKALKAAAEERAQQDPAFRKYLDELTKATAAAAQSSPMMTAPAPGKKLPGSGATPTAVFPHIFPWGHNDVPPGAIGFNPAVDYDLPNWSVSPNIRKFVDGLPGLGAANKNNLNQYIPVAAKDTATYPGSDFYEITTKQYPLQMHSDLPPTTIIGYAQVAGSGPGQASDTTVGGVKQYLGPAIIAKVYDPTKPPATGTNGEPVRMLFHNELPLSNDLVNKYPVPLDPTLMGAGMGPNPLYNFTTNRVTIPHLHGGHTPWINDGTPHQWITPANDPISVAGAAYQKGSSFQNVPDMVGPGPGKIATPAPNDGMGTSFYTNDQSARLMFYHDHAWGITRLNVYAGAAAPYLLYDQVELDLISGTNVSGVFGALPVRQILPDQMGLDRGAPATSGGLYTFGIPLVIQDKSFVNDATTPLVAADTAFPGGIYPKTFKTNDVDPLWYTYVGTGGGNLWMGHEYMPVENIFNETGGSVGPLPDGSIFEWPAGDTTNGRWDYAPFMIPPMVPNNLTLPSPTTIPESFGDTMVVNGTAFPYIELPPDTVRFRILGVGNDRVLNLSWFKAEPLTLRITNGGSGYTGCSVGIDPPPGGTTATAVCTVTNGVVTGITVTDPGSGYRLPPAAPPRVLILDPGGTGLGATAYASVATEVKMVDAARNPAAPTWPVDGRDGGVPDPQSVGPNWVLIGNESGFLAKPVVIPPQPVDYEYVRQAIPFASVTSHSLLLLPAQRADVVVDFRGYHDGDVLILYNDAPAPMSMFWPINDYYSDCPDQRIVGGPPPIPPGFGPNTRTVMQVRIKGVKTSSFNFDVTALQAAMPQAFAASQPKPLVPALAYNAAFPGFATRNVYAQAPDSTLNLTGTGQGISRIVASLPGNGYTTGPRVTIVGGGGSGAAAVAGINGVGAIVMTTFGSGYTTVPTVAVGAPNVAGGIQCLAVALISGGQVTGIEVTEPGSGYTAAPLVTITGGGGTGATATATFTLGTVGSITVTNPGTGYTSEPRVYLTGGGGIGAQAVALITGAGIMTSKNITEGFDTDYGRMDIKLGSTPNPLTPTVGAGPVIGIARYIDPPTEFVNDGETTLWRLTHLGVDSHALHFHLFDVQVVNRIDWTNGVKPPYDDEIGWRETIRTNPMEDIIVAFRPKSMAIPFQIPLSNRLLDPTTLAGSTVNFLPIPPPPGIPAVGQLSNVMTNFQWEYVYHCHMLGHEENDFMRTLSLVVPPPAAPSGLARTLGAAGVVLTWADNSTNESKFTIQRATNAGFTAGLTTFTAPANAVTYTDNAGLTAGPNYRYRVRSENGAGLSAWSNVVNITITAPAAPSGLSATAVVGGIRLAWAYTNNATPATGFTIQRATNATFTANLTTFSGLPLTPLNYTDLTAAVGTRYYYRVRAESAFGPSAWSTSVNILITGPAAPTGLTATAGNGGVVLVWVNNATNATGVTVQRATDTLFTLNVVTFAPVLAATATTYTDTTAVVGTRYYYDVRAESPLGPSAWSTAANILVSALAINTTALPTGYVGIPYNQTLAATGGFPPYTWTLLTGSLPPVLTLNTATGAITGTPTTAAAYPFTVQVADTKGTIVGPASLSITVAATPPSLAFDVQNIWTDQGTRTNTVVSPTFSTTAANELLLVFVATNPAFTNSPTTVTGVTGGGLTWTLARRTNVRYGTSEIWWAFAPAILTNASVTATLSRTDTALLGVMSFTGVDTTSNGAGAIGATGTGNSAGGPPTASLTTTRLNSWVFGVGNDYTSGTTPVAGPNQTVLHSYLSPFADTYWVQRINATPILASGATATINDTAPAADMYNLSIIEIRTP